MSKNNLKAYVRYDGSGRIIPGSLILNRFKPKVGNWKETNSSLCCNGGLCYTITVTLAAGDGGSVSWKDSFGDDQTSSFLIGKDAIEFSICAQPGSISVTTETGIGYTISPAGAPCSGLSCIPACLCYTFDYQDIEYLKYTTCNGIVVEPPTKGTFSFSDCVREGSISYIIGSVDGAYINVTGGTTSCTAGDDCI